VDLCKHRHFHCCSIVVPLEFRIANCKGVDLTTCFCVEAESVLIIVKVINNINKVIKLNKNKDSRDLPSSKSTSGSLSAHHHHHTFAASMTGIHLGVTDRGLFYRPIHSAKAALPKRRRRRSELQRIHLNSIRKTDPTPVLKSGLQRSRC
jgi:hypothetical protein